MKNSAKTAGKACLIVIILTLINCILLVLSFCLPTAPMRKNVAESYPLIGAEHQYLQWDQGYTSSMLDFWSEYTLYGAAINEDADGNAFERAMLMWYIDTPGVDRDKAVDTYARFPEEHFELTAYPRYWNGIVIIMKLLLLVFTIPDIRMISMFLNLALLLVMAVLMAKRNLLVELISLVTAILFINPITMIYSVIFSAEFIPMLVSIILILLFYEKIEGTDGGWELFFAINGAVLSFFSFLSAPFMALGFPLVVLIWCKRGKNTVKTVISSSCFWGVAYGITWAMKWIICTVCTSYNLIKDAFDRMDMYENVGNPGNSGVSAVGRVIQNLWPYRTPAFILLFIICVLLVFIALCFREKRSDEVVAEGNLVGILAGYFLVACMPIVITVGLGNGYAYKHSFMTHRNFAITVLASLCIFQTVFSMLLNKMNEANK